MVPLGSHSAASLPSSAAIRSCNAFTVGSSPYWSSPTGAAAIAARIGGDGRVTVSERRSMGVVVFITRGYTEDMSAHETIVSAIDARAAAVAQLARKIHANPELRF